MPRDDHAGDATPSRGKQARHLPVESPSGERANGSAVGARLLHMIVLYGLSESSRGV